ncbi:hypothetical protein MMC13_007207 [Lambiella insularis]|nr:hypothetical protein [Lambiella insularis]
MLSPTSCALALTCLATSALAQALAFTNAAFDGIAIGAPFELTWQGDGAPVTITLVNGTPTDINYVAVVAADAPSPSFLWTPAGFSPVGEYVLIITQSSSTAYGGPFAIAAASSFPSSSPPSSSSAPSSPPPTTLDPSPMSFTTTFDSSAPSSPASSPGTAPPPSAAPSSLSPTPAPLAPFPTPSSPLLAYPPPAASPTDSVPAIPALLMSFLSGGAPSASVGLHGPGALRGPYASGAPYLGANTTVGAGMGRPTVVETVGCTGLGAPSGGVGWGMPIVPGGGRRVEGKAAGRRQGEGGWGVAMGMVAGGLGLVGWV